MASNNLQGKVVVITGASSGIGLATAKACARAGMHITLAARRESKLRAAAAEVARIGPTAQWVTCNVDDDDDVAALFEQSWKQFGRLDAAFANAGYGLISPVMELNDREHRRVFETNYFGTLRVIHEAVPRLRETNGGLRHVLICASAASEIALPTYGAYCATKAAQDSIGGALRAELHGYGYRVSTVHPIGTKTSFFDRAGATANNTPAGMMQPPDRVARAVVKCLRRPKPEVWPSTASRFGLALTTAFPGLAARLMHRHYRKLKARASKPPQPAPAATA